MSQEIAQNIIDSFVGAAHGDFDAVKSLLAQYPDLLLKRASWQESAMEAAAQMGRVDITEYLLAAGAHMDICTAAMLGRMTDVLALLEEDPGLINGSGAHGIPLIYFPVITGNRELADLLFSRGCPVDGGEGVSTPLHGAVMFNQVEMAGWLLDKGARLNVKDFKGKTPLEAARETNRDAIVRLLEVHSAG